MRLYVYMSNMEKFIKTFAQSCDSRECKKKYKKEISDMCDAITTVHTYNVKTREVICTECGKTYKLAK